MHLDKPNNQMSLKRARSPTLHATSGISSSSKIKDRRSTFIALYSPSLSAAELQARPEFKDATHRIAAWRKPGSQKSLKTSEPLVELGYDDDGEKYGGKTIGKLMESMNVQGSVVVARWYGGVMLGPARFDHIRNCAKEAISKWLAENSEAGKSKKFQLEDEQKEKLVKTLHERDESIAVLRGLLAEKKGQRSPQQSPTGSPAKVPDYEKQPVQVLKRLEDVRDATIGWILKGIEESEKESKEVEKEVGVGDTQCKDESNT